MPIKLFGKTTERPKGHSIQPQTVPFKRLRMCLIYPLSQTIRSIGIKGSVPQLSQKEPKIEKRLSWKKKFGCGLCTKKWKLNSPAERLTFLRKQFEQSSCHTGWKWLSPNWRGPGGPSNAIGAKQADETIQLQTSTNHVLQVFYCGPWERWEQLFRILIVQSFKKWSVSFSTDKSTERTSCRDGVFYLLVYKDLQNLWVINSILSLFLEEWF